MAKDIFHNVRVVIYPKSYCIKVNILLVGCVVLAVCSGIFYNWVTLVMALESQGVFAELCVNDTMSNITDPTTCVERELAFSFIFSVAMLVNGFSSLVNGYIVDIFGGRVLLFISSTMYGVGCLIFGFSTTKLNLFALGTALATFGGNGLFTGLFPLMRDMGTWMNISLTIWSCAWDSSVVVFLVYYYIYSATGLSYRVFFIALSFMTILIYFLLIIWPRGSDRETDKEELEAEKEEQNEKDDFVEEDVLLPRDLAEPSFFKVLISPFFISYCIYYGILVLWCNFYIGLVSYQLAFTRAGPEMQELGVQIFSYVFTGSIFLGLLVAYLVDQLGIVQNFIIIQASFFLFTFLKLIPNIYVQFANFVVFIFARSQFYCATWIWVAKAFPKKHYGKLIGVSQVVGGLSSTLQYPLFAIVITHLNGKFAVIDGIQGVTLVIGCFFIVAVAGREYKKNVSKV